MTTLAAFQGNGWAVIGCDSRASDEGGRAMDLATPKVVANGEYLIAVSGASRGGNISQFGWTPPTVPKNITQDSLDKFMTRTFIPSLRHAFQDAGYDAKDDGDAAFQDSNLIIMIRGIIYPIFEDYSWDREVFSFHSNTVLTSTKAGPINELVNDRVNYVVSLKNGSGIVFAIIYDCSEIFVL